MPGKAKNEEQAIKAKLNTKLTEKDIFFVIIF